jgi:Ser/Thr protein kinase RdoA (MazF antagonist)
MPGVADYWSDPRPPRLDAAMQTLAAIHNVFELHQPLTPSESQRLQLLGIRGSYSVNTRARRLQRLVDGELERTRSRLDAAAPNEERDLGFEALALVRELAPAELAKAQHWRQIDLPMQQRLGDVHHDHILFTGDSVTGVIDFGAADFDSPAGDVARLLGSLVGDDRQRRRQGLEAYQRLHPLTPDEVAVVDFFDSSGTVAAAANWLVWLWSMQPPRGDREAGLRRLRQLVQRLRTLGLRSP